MSQNALLYRLIVWYTLPVLVFFVSMKLMMMDSFTIQPTQVSKVDRAPAIIAPASDKPIGENAHLYKNLTLNKE